jgi:hypothetical protein
MKNKYRVYILGDIPTDLRQRIAELHANGILNGREVKKSNSVGPTQGENEIRKTK